MKVCLLGYGKMGKAIELILAEKGHSITGIITRSNFSDLSKVLSESEVCIEFTGPESAFQNLNVCLEAEVPVVSGSTGWLQQWDTLIQNYSDKSGRLLWASNFSIGVNICFELNRMLAKMAGVIGDYQFDIKEIHHLAKLDKPSGTAISFAQDILKEHPELHQWILDPQIEVENLLAIRSNREADVIGYHEINCKGSQDRITLIHEAFNRRGFSEGAVLGAEWLLGQKSGCYGMQDMLKNLMKKGE